MPQSRSAARIAGSGSAHPAPPMRGAQGAGRQRRIGDAAGEPTGSADGIARGELAAPGGGVHAHALSGSERRCGEVPRMGKRGGRSSQGAGTRSRARRAARKARGVGGALQAAGRAEPSMRAAHGVRGGEWRRAAGRAVRGLEGPKSFARECTCSILESGSRFLWGTYVYLFGTTYRLGLHDINV